MQFNIYYCKYNYNSDTQSVAELVDIIDFSGNLYEHLTLLLLWVVIVGR